MTSLLNRFRLWWIGLRKTASLIVDSFRPSGIVELRLIHATGPKKGQVHKVLKGRNVVTSWISSSVGTSGRDLMRKILAPPTGILSGSTGSMAGDTGAYVQYMMLGSSSVAEDATDTSLGTALDGTGDTENTKIQIGSYVLDASNPYITFVAEWSESEANTSVSEVALISGRTGVNADFIARKTFSTFTKTNEFSLEIRWTLRF